MTEALTHIAVEPDHAGIAALCSYEGLRLTAYQDQNGVWTIGYGHTGRMTPPVVIEGMTCSMLDATNWFTADVDAFCQELTEALAGAATTQGQLNAMLSLAYNIGINGFKGSTVLRKHLAQDYEHAADAFLLWNKAGGQVDQGLVNRREKERAMYLADSPANT